MRLIIASSVLLLSAVLFACTNEPREERETPLRPDSIVVNNPDKPVSNFAGVDISPMDMAYFPVDYPKLKMANHSIPPPVARVIYSRPHLGSRRLFPDILKHGEPWRLGANEATELDLYKEVSILGNKVRTGRYNLYCVPQPGKWTIVLNSNVDTWGLKQDSSLDVHRFEIPISTGHPSQEYFTMEFQQTASGCDLSIAWDDVIGKLPFTF
ncbi:MAG: DUF2911 domain-containing protein [Chitinophagaceae bacterium]|nr:MAG: DUF2911 domain-containing protein [Chitinophagaceae bacterium]